jgi:serine/tyrosine/threonine adenylyltransferase
MQLQFENRFARTLPGDTNESPHSRQVHGAFWSPVVPMPVSAPKLVAHSREVATMLGLDENELRSAGLVNALSGNAPLPGMQTYATIYGGHQFGNWAGQLGDGRAIFLGELVNPRGEHYELQLKGAGPTPYSRRADGRAVLRSSIREFLCSEAMHYLGVPTTRALSLVLTGDVVERDMFYDGNAEMEPGAIVCRVAPSFLRFGHFEIFASRGESQLLRQLIDFTITNYFPRYATLNDNERILAWLGDVCERTARLIAEWMRVGFVHGVMNTDNMSILGLTIDYGPYGWVDNFDPGWTPNTTDAQGRRYCFGRQPGIAQWNLARLGDALATLGIEPESLVRELAKYEATYSREIKRVYSDKFGLDQWSDDEGDLIEAAFQLMSESQIDMTIFFRTLAVAREASEFRDAFYLEGEWSQAREKFAAWFARYLRACGAQPNTELNADGETRKLRMNAANPKYVLRNYLAQEAIDLAHGGDYSRIAELLDVLRKPYDEQPDHQHFAAKRPDWALNKAGCSMLSCSS